MTEDRLETGVDLVGELLDVRVGEMESDLRVFCSAYEDVYGDVMGLVESGHDITRRVGGMLPGEDPQRVIMLGVIAVDLACSFALQGRRMFDLAGTGHD